MFLPSLFTCLLQRPTVLAACLSLCYDSSAMNIRPAWYLPLGLIAVAGWLALTFAVHAQSVEGPAPDHDLADVVERPPAREEFESPAPERPETEVKAGVALELRAKIAQLMLATLQGTVRLDPTDQEILAQYPPGGVILPTVVRPASAAKYIGELRAVYGTGRGAPLLIGTNLYDLPLERSAANTFFTQLPAPMAVAAADDPAATKKLAGLLAEHLALMGFNLHLGPCLVLAPSLDGTRGDLRYFGSDPEFAASAGMQFLDALEERGIVGMAVGFPGGARRKPDEPAVLSTPRPLLENGQNDLLPFSRALEAGAPMVLVGNTLVPTLDRQNLYASVSPVVMRDILRGQMGFTGVIVAGPMDAGELVKLGSPIAASIRALDAGADMLYWKEPGRHVMKVIDGLVRAVQEGRLSLETVDAAVVRVVELKNRFKLGEGSLPDPDQALQLEKKKRYAETSYDIERRSITVVQNRGGLLPLGQKGTVPFGITGGVGVEDLQKALEEYVKQVPVHVIATAKHVGDIMDFEVARVTRYLGGMRTIICVFGDRERTTGQLELLRQIRAAGLHVVVVLLGYPSNLPLFTEADAIVLAYCEPPSCAQSLRAVADVLVGQGPVKILPAVREMETRVGDVITFSVFDVIRVPAGSLPVAIGDQFKTGHAVPCNPTQAISKATWQIGDGRPKKAEILNHVFEAAGRYPAVLTVLDSKKAESSAEFEIVVE